MGRKELVDVILDDSPQSTVEAMLDALAGGASGIDLASAVSYAAALRIARGDGDRALAHATQGPCLQQNLVCVLEGE